MNNETKFFINIFENDADFIGWKKDANSELENRWIIKQKTVLENIIERLENPVSFNEDNKKRKKTLNYDSKTDKTRILNNEKVKNKKKMIKSKKYLKQNINKANSKKEDIEFNERLVKSFLVLKSDINDKKRVPLLWRIFGFNLLEKYISFRKNGKVLYKPSKEYSIYIADKVENLLYYRAPVSLVKKTSTKLIIDFHKDKVKKKENKDEEKQK